MFWVFFRDRDEIRLETASGVHNSEFVVNIVHADGRRGSERFADHRQFWTWLLAMRRALAAQNWTLSGPFRSTDVAPPVVDRSTEILTVGQSNSRSQLCRCGGRAFRIVISTRELLGISRWVIEDVVDEGSAERERVPGMFTVASTSPEAAFREAYAQIESWLRSLQDQNRSTVNRDPQR